MTELRCRKTLEEEREEDDTQCEYISHSTRKVSFLLQLLLAYYT